MERLVVRVVPVDEGGFFSSVDREIGDILTTCGSTVGVTEKIYPHQSLFEVSWQPRYKVAKEQGERSQPAVDCAF